MIDRDGLVPDMPEVEYHTGGTELSSTGAKTILRSPRAYRDRASITQTPAMLRGSIFHSLVLGAGPAYRPYDGSRATKSTKEQIAQIEADGATPVTRAVFDTAAAMADAVMSHPLASRWLADGSPEQSMFWTHNETGVRCRGRIDWLGFDKITDLKSAADASPEGFARAAYNLGYSIQNYWYSEGFEQITGEMLPFAFIVCEPEPPYLVGCYELDDEFFYHGAAKAKQARQMFRDCTESGLWPDWPTDQHTLSLPRWARKDYAS